MTRPNSGAIRSTERARALGVRSGAARRRNRKPKDAPKDAATASHWFAWLVYGDARGTIDPKRVERLTANLQGFLRAIEHRDDEEMADMQRRLKAVERGPKWGR